MMPWLTCAGESPKGEHRSAAAAAPAQAQLTSISAAAILVKMTLGLNWPRFSA
jgi:hypothetical protein